MSKAQNGDTVKVSYVGKLKDGTIFDKSKDDNLLQFTIGQGEVIPGFEEAIVDMTIGESKTVLIPVDKAYGPYDDAKTFPVAKSAFPEGFEPKTGQRLEVQDENGTPVVVSVSAILETEVVLDANHPLAGEDLNFEITLSEIV